jgi:hypothetical protein
VPAEPCEPSPPEDDAMSLPSSAGALVKSMNPVAAIKRELETLKREQAQPHRCLWRNHDPQHE